jgi:hypothetical protein
MKNHVSTAAGAAVAACVLMALLGAGVAAAGPGASDVVGMTYASAKAAFSEAGVTPVVATVFGDRLPQDQCYVVSVSQATFLNQNPPVASGGTQVQVNLSCYPKDATARNPGFSTGNGAPDAEAIRNRSKQEELAWKKTALGQKWCAQAQEKHPEWGVIEGC